MDPFVAEVRIFPFNFPPVGWAWCNGQILPISQNTALFSLLGTTYGGNGLNTFALPNLMGKAPMQPGQGPGLSSRYLGEEGGSEVVSLLESEIPAHNHTVRVDTINPGEVVSPTDAIIAKTTAAIYSATAVPATTMSGQALAPTGGGQPHNNMQPYITLNFNIALQGVFPPRP